ncbi:MAG: hypothetical protein AAF963_02190 [Bacteroidota bacterium]
MEDDKLTRIVSTDGGNGRELASIQAVETHNNNLTGITEAGRSSVEQEEEIEEPDSFPTLAQKKAFRKLGKLSMFNSESKGLDEIKKDVAKHLYTLLNKAQRTGCIQKRTGFKFITKQALDNVFQNTPSEGALKNAVNAAIELAKPYSYVTNNSKQNGLITDFIIKAIAVSLRVKQVVDNGEDVTQEIAKLKQYLSTTKKDEYYAIDKEEQTLTPKTIKNPKKPIKESEKLEEAREIMRDALDEFLEK